MGIYHLQSGFWLHWSTNLNSLFLVLNLFSFFGNTVTSEHPFFCCVRSPPQSPLMLYSLPWFLFLLLLQRCCPRIFHLLFCLYTFSVCCTRESLRVEQCFHTRNFHSHYSWALWSTSSRMPVPFGIFSWTSCSHCKVHTSKTKFIIFPTE